MTLPKPTTVQLFHLEYRCIPPANHWFGSWQGNARQADNLEARAVLVRRCGAGCEHRIFYIVPHTINGVFTVGLRPWSCTRSVRQSAPVLLKPLHDGSNVTRVSSVWSL